MNQSLDADDMRKSIERHFTQALEDLKASASDRSESTASVDIEIDALDTIFQVYCREINEMKRKRFERRNTLIPIRTLPNELLAYTLLLSLRPVDKQTLTRLRALAQVSRHWWSLILHTPAFWTRVDSVAMLRTQLRLSGTLPLDIIFHDTVISGEHGNLIKAECHRLRTLCYHSSDWEILVPSSGLHSPQLQSICIGKSSAWQRSVYVAEVCPVQHLDLEHVFPDWTSPSYFGRLTYLALRMFDPHILHSKIPTRAFTQVMDICVMLEELCLDTVVPDDYSLLPLATAGERLPRLRRLSLFTIPEKLSAYILRSLHPFQIEEFYIEHFDPEGFVHFLPQDADILPPEASSIISSILLRTSKLRVNLNITSDDLRISFLGDTGVVVDMRVCRCENHLAALQQTLQGISLDKASTALNLDSSWSSESITDMVTGFPRLQLDVCYLQISSTTLYDTSILHSIASLPHFPFPNISHIHFDGLSINSENLPKAVGNFFRSLLLALPERSKEMLLVTDDDASWTVRDPSVLGGVTQFLGRTDGGGTAWPRMTTPSNSDDPLVDRHVRRHIALSSA